MTIHIPSFALGFMFTWALCCAGIAVMILVDMWRAKKKRERELDWLLAEVGIACLERPTDVRGN